ncbi:MAG: ImmA/IrrE family metallo-endopeptidase [Thaumarchaeota archaeon]|nr:ImmA/IrrE family metallo-endopeptidase [Nitrososphaerota archaeon]
MSNQKLGLAFESLAQKLGYKSEKLGNIDEQRNQIRRLLDSYINNLLWKAKELTPPINPENIAPLVGVREIRKTLWHSDGSLIPRKDGFEIIINSQTKNVRQRSVCAHEIGHTFFYNWNDGTPTKIFYDIPYWEEEGMVYEIARKILIPTNLITKMVKSRHITFQNLQEMAQTFGVSYEFIIRRLGDLDLLDSVILLIEIINESKTDYKYKVKIKNKPTWDKNKLIINGGKFIAKNDKLHDLLDTVSKQSNPEIIHKKMELSNSSSDKFQISIAKMGGTKPYIVVLISPEPKENKQLKLDDMALISSS